MKSGLAILMLTAVSLAGAPGCGADGNKEPQAPAGSGASSRGDAVAGGQYKVNPAESKFAAHVGVGGLLAAAGHPHTIAIREFEGELKADPEKLAPASLRIVIKAASLGEAGKEFDDKERQKVNVSVHDEALETSKYPDIVFKGSVPSVKQVGEGRYEATMKGDLTLHGVTRPLSFPVSVRRSGRSLRAAGEFTILHGDYNIKRLSAGAGMIKAKEEIVISFDIQADES